MGKRHTTEQIIRKLRQAEADLAGGLTVGQVCQKLGVSEQTFHRWRARYGGGGGAEGPRGAGAGGRGGTPKRPGGWGRRTSGSGGWWPTWPWTSRCSRRWREKNSDRRRPPPGRAAPAGGV